MSKQWEPLFLKEGWMIHSAVGMFVNFNKFIIDFDKSEPQHKLNMFRISSCSVDFNISTRLRENVSLSSSRL